MTFLTELERLRAAGFPILATAEFISANADAIAEVVKAADDVDTDWNAESAKRLRDALAKLEGK